MVEGLRIDENTSISESLEKAIKTLEGFEPEGDIGKAVNRAQILCLKDVWEMIQARNRFTESQMMKLVESYPEVVKKNFMDNIVKFCKV